MNCLRYPDTPCRFRCTNFCRLGGIGYPKDRGGPLFLPSDLPNLAAWFRYGAGITSATALVSQWADQSGNGRHLKQATDTNKPALQADGSILFDGADNYLKTDAFTLDQPCTFYFLGKQVTWTDIDKIFDGDAANSGALQQRTTTPGIRLAAGSATGLNNDLAVDTYGVVACVFNGASSVLQVNNGATVTGNPGAANPGGITLGAGGTPVGNYGNIQAKELIAYAVAHDAGQRAKIIEYLARLGNLTI